MYDMVNYLRIYDTVTGVTTPVARVPIPTGNKASKTSQCETVRKRKIPRIAVRMRHPAGECLK